MNRRTQLRSSFYQSAAAHVAVCVAITFAMQAPLTRFKAGTPGHTSQMLFIEAPPLVARVPISTQATQKKAPKLIPIALPTELAHAPPREIPPPDMSDLIVTKQAQAIPAASAALGASAAEMSKVITQTPPSAGGNGGAYGKADAPSALALYLTRVGAKVRPNLQYLVNLKRIRLKGEVGVRFTILETGLISGLEVIQTSGHPELDQTAQAAVLRAQPFERLTALGQNNMTVRIPVVFKPDL